MSGHAELNTDLISSVHCIIIIMEEVIGSHRTWW